MIIGLTGPSGVGKGFIKNHLRIYYPELTELTVVTTRSRRQSDSRDRETDVPVTMFLQRENSGEITFAHQPFGTNGDWYGFIADELSRATDPHMLVLTEIHVDNAPTFKQRYGENIVIVGLTADQGYLEQNLSLRDTETPENRSSRLNRANQEVIKIQQLYESGAIDTLIDVHAGVRGELAAMAQASIEVLIKDCRAKEGDL